VSAQDKFLRVFLLAVCGAVFVRRKPGFKSRIPCEVYTRAIKLNEQLVFDQSSLGSGTEVEEQRNYIRFNKFCDLVDDMDPPGVNLDSSTVEHAGSESRKAMVLANESGGYRIIVESGHLRIGHVVHGEKLCAG